MANDKTVLVRLINLQRELHSNLSAAAKSAGPQYHKAVIAGGIADEAAGIASSMAALNGIVENALKVATEAAAELESIQAVLDKKPTD